MREERPSQFWHVSERYIRSRRRRVELVYRAGHYLQVDEHSRYVKIEPHHEVVVGFVTAGEHGKHVKGTLGPFGCIVESWSPRVRQSKVEKGVDWLADAFVGTPYLPVEFLEAA
jgi:hypothetical protein